ncbi:hypothetical protein BC833DRAFT_569734, partial [Globomyces pollinis-pini]
MQVPESSDNGSSQCLVLISVADCSTREALQKALSNSLVDSISVSFNTYSNLFQSYKYSQVDLETLIWSLNGTHDSNIIQSIITNNLDGIYNWESIICSAVRSKSDTVIQLVLGNCASVKPELSCLDEKIFDIESFNLDQLKLFLKADIFQINNKLVILAISSNKLAILQYCIDSGVPLVDPSTEYEIRNTIEAAIEKKYIELLRYVIQQPGLSGSSTKKLLTNAAVVYCPDILGGLWKAGLLLLHRQYNFNSPYEFEPFPLVGYRTVSQISQSEDMWEFDYYTVKDINLCVDLVALQLPNNNFTPQQLMKLYIITGNHSKFEDLLDSSDLLSTASDQFWSECWDQIGRYHHYPDASNFHMFKLLLKNNIVGPYNYWCFLAIDGEDFELIELLIRHNFVGKHKAFQTMDKCIQFNRQDLLPLLGQISELYESDVAFDKDHLWFWKEKIATKALTEDEVEFFEWTGLWLGLEELVDDMI